MPDTIEQTVRQIIAPFDGSLPAGADQVIGEVIVTLRVREQAIYATLLNEATSEGIGENVARGAIEEAGLEFAPAPTLRPVDGASEQQKASVRNLLTKLEQNRVNHRDMAQSVDSYVADVKAMFDI